MEQKVMTSLLAHLLWRSVSWLMMANLFTVMVTT